MEMTKIVIVAARKGDERNDNEENIHNFLVREKYIGVEGHYVLGPAHTEVNQDTINNMMFMNVGESPVFL